ncbi:hypothetical protein BGZ93_003927 [Podila epicladia]|nr:hypothetical protein BGZ92_000398 [Podila epicladia]KAG0096816.1 hypothetical protein BGZ93_003927 [Podila epicladia]
MSTFISVFDIHLIIDTICVDLSLYDIQSCRRVNKQWSVTFKPYLWSATKLYWTSTLCDKEIDALLKNKHWIRSLTVDAEHVETISGLSAFTTLQELVFGDGNTECRQEEHGVVKIENLVALIDSNTHLQSLEIDLHSHHYSSVHLLSALTLAITRHPTLSKLTWRVPEDHNRDGFARCIMYACHSIPIQELYIYERSSSRPKYYSGCYQVGCTTCYPRRYYSGQAWFENDIPEVNDTTTTANSTTSTVIPWYTDFACKSDQSLDAHNVFVFQRLHLESQAFGNFHLPLLNASPELQYVTLSCFTALELETLAGHPSLRGLDFRHVRYGTLNYSTELERFSQHCLQSVHLPEMSWVQFSMVVHVLQKSHIAALEILGMHRDSATNKDIVAVLNMFPSLKEVDFGDVKIYLRGRRQRGRGGGGDAQDLDHESCVQSLGDLYSMATIARDWDPAQKRRLTGDMADWWKHWNRAATFMKAVREEYMKLCRVQSCKRSIRMRFMYPFRHFMSRRETEEYRRLRNRWGFTLTDAHCMAQTIEKEVERKKEEIRKERNADMGVDPEEEQEEESEGEWSGYDQVEEELELEREYSVAKSRNRHHNLKSKMRSVR